MSKANVSENITKVAEILTASAESEVLAAQAAGEVSTKDLKTGLEACKVPAHKIAAFVKVYRFYRQGLSMGFKAPALVQVKPGIAGQIGKAIAENKPVSKKAYELAITDEPDGIEIALSYGDGETAQKLKDRKAEAEKRKAFGKLSDKDKARETLRQAIAGARKAGLSPEVEVLAILQAETEKAQQAAQTLQQKVA